MNAMPDIREELRRHLRDATSSFSIGSFGAIAEFHRDAEEPLSLDDSETLTIATSRGALRIDLVEGVRPLAYETLSRRTACWQQGVVFCLPQAEGQSRRRSVLTELGPDAGAVRSQDRAAILFDMGLGARNVDFCIRTSDQALLGALREACGRSVFEPGNGVMGAIIAASPHRIALSRLGRAEVYQAIGREKTPEGPHTHVLPKFLKTGRTHSANIPVPRGWLPCLSLHPASPLFDGLGRRIPFDPARHERFQALLEGWALPAYRDEKARLRKAIGAGHRPDGYRAPKTRLGRTALRVALRQMSRTEGDSTALDAWQEAFDRPAG